MQLDSNFSDLRARTALITGASNGIGKACAELFCAEGINVIGVDRCNIEPIIHPRYQHVVYDITEERDLSDVVNTDIDYLVCSAGTQNEDDIQVNLISTIHFIEALTTGDCTLQSIVNIASTSAHNGAEFPEYAASKGGLLAYTKNLAMRLGKYGTRCNTISPGGVYTSMNQHIIDDDDMLQKCLDETLLKRWATAEEIAQWVYFVSVINKSMTGQDIIIDNGELCNFNFVW